MRFPFAVFLLAVFFPATLVCPAQTPPNGFPPANPSPAPRAPSEALSGVLSGTLQPSIDALHRTLDQLRLEKWKRGALRDEAQGYIVQIQNDLGSNLPPLLAQADAAPGAVSKVLPVLRHLDALYDVLLRVVEAARISAPDDQADQLQQALATLGSTRLALGDRLQGSADAAEKQIVDLDARIRAQAARAAAPPIPVALPCVAPPAHRATVRRNATSTQKKPAPPPASAKPKPASGAPNAATPNPSK
jgi:hypothetical protein